MTDCLNSGIAASVCTSGKTNGLRIAVFVHNGLTPSAPHEAEGIAIYARQNEAWEQRGQVHIRPLSSMAPASVTAHMEYLAKTLERAQAVAGASVSGIAYRVFSMAGKHIFEIPELSQDQLSGIAEDIALADAKRKTTEEAFQKTLPTETDIEGVYTLDLVTALEEFPELSSKMILQPFFRSTPFLELTLICHHVPHWLLREKELTIAQKQRGEYQVVAVMKTTCQEAMP